MSKSKTKKVNPIRGWMLVDENDDICGTVILPDNLPPENLINSTLRALSGNKKIRIVRVLITEIAK